MSVCHSIPDPANSSDPVRICSWSSISIQGRLYLSRTATERGLMFLFRDHTFFYLFVVFSSYVVLAGGLV